MLQTTGVFYTHDKDLALERGLGEGQEYEWLHIISGKRGSRVVWVATDMPTISLTVLLNHWNRAATEWKYWSV